MDMIREQMKRPLVMGAAGLVLGMIIGLIVLGWGVWPVKWVDASPAFLRDDVKQDYLRMAIDSFAVNQDKSLAIQRWEALGETAPDVLTEVLKSPKATKLDQVNAFAVAVSANQVTSAQPEATKVSGGGTSTTGESGGSKIALPVVLGVAFVLVLVVAAALAYVFLMRNRQMGAGAGTKPANADPSSGKRTTAESQIFSPTRQEPPVAQFMTTYLTGDDMYDDSFSIDSPSGEFLGECGVGISDTIGVGDPKKVTALEVWLFDKNDIQTVTKVLMSSRAFNDPATFQRLEAKGEPFLVERGKQVVLETAALQLVATVSDMEYGKGAMPDESYFERLTLEIAVWPKPAAK
jgi:hypothetical protein